MKLGIMQPYFFPYLGYWQLMNLVDRYIIYDDVNFIKGGYINRNSILLSGKEHMITLPLLNSSPNRLINEISLFREGVHQAKILKTISQAYAKSPYFSAFFPVLKEALMYSETNLAKYLAFSITTIARYLGMATEFVLSSEIEKDTSLKGSEKVIDICRRQKATSYYNAIGGQSLYNADDFKASGIQLAFLKMNSNIAYKQFGSNFVENLSIIDILMFNSPEECQQLLTQYEII